jgi:phage N-6-adenine-methyltransferase
MGLIGRPRLGDRPLTNAERQARHRQKVAAQLAQGLARRVAYLGVGQRDDWGTPPGVFARLDAEYHFTLDVCASAWNAKCPRYFTVEDDGLQQSWAGETCWLNPPYGQAVTSWLQKASMSRLEGALTVALIPARVGTYWWDRHVAPLPSRDVQFLVGRLRFLLPDGPAPDDAPFSSAVVIFRPSGGRAS